MREVETFNLNKAVKRNLDRFPEDFMFQLTSEEVEPLKFQIGMSKQEGRGGRRTPPYAFTELGVAMLSSVLNSQRAVQMNILIMRAFVKLRELLVTSGARGIRRGETSMEARYSRMTPYRPGSTGTSSRTTMRQANSPPPRTPQTIR